MATTIGFKSAGLSEKAMRALERAPNKSEYIRRALEHYESRSEYEEILRQLKELKDLVGKVPAQAYPVTADPSADCGNNEKEKMEEELLAGLNLF